MMSYESRLRSAHDELRNAGIWKSNYNPPLHRIFRWLGANSRPPFYRSFIVNFLTSSAYFGTTWGVIMWFSVWETDGMDLSIAVITALSAGILFGLTMAFYYWSTFRKHNLTKWNDLR